jgi:hypothetical protein
MPLRQIISALSAVALLAFGANAVASEKPEAENSADRQMVAPNIVTPVVRDGKLVNYLFVTVEVDFTDQANAIKVRDRAHFLRDALLKTTHRLPLADPTHDDQLDKPAALAAFRMAAKDALGAENVKSVSIVGVDSLRRR